MYTKNLIQDVQTVRGNQNSIVMLLWKQVFDSVGFYHPATHVIWEWPSEQKQQKSIQIFILQIMTNFALIWKQQNTKSYSLFPAKKTEETKTRCGKSNSGQLNNANIYCNVWLMCGWSQRVQDKNRANITRYPGHCGLRVCTRLR